MFFTKRDLEITGKMAKARLARAKTRSETLDMQALLSRVGAALHDLAEDEREAAEADEEARCKDCGEADRTKGDHGKRRGECSPY